MKRTPIKKKSPLKKKPKKKSKQKLATIQKRRMDTLWSKIIRRSGKCLKCGKTDGRLNAHHTITRSALATRWDIQNGIPLCCRCHTFGNDSAHRNPHAFSVWLEDTHPERWVWIRENRWRNTKIDLDYTEQFLKDVLTKLEEKK